MATQQEQIVKIYTSGQASESQMRAIEELAKRGLVELPKLEPTMEQLGAEQAAKETGAMSSFGIGYGKGSANLLRGVGIMDEETPSEKTAIQALKREHPIATGLGEMAAETAPFLIPGTQVGRIGSLGGRMAASGGLGALEGGIIASGTGEDVAPGALMGAAIGAVGEAIFPFVGRYARNLYRRIRGREPSGQLVDANGQPTPEFRQTLQDAGVSYDDLLQEVQQQVQQLPAGSNPQQAARLARAQQEGVNLTTGEITKDYGQQGVEQRLFESTQDLNAEPFRQFKLQQSEQIRSALENVMGDRILPEESGALIKEALTGRRNLLRTQKNDLYREVAQNAENIGGVPLFTDNIREAIPNERTMRSLSVTKEGEVNKLNNVLREYGIIEPDPNNIPEFYEPLNLENFDTFRKTLNNLEREDQSGTMSVAIRPIREALDREIDELSHSIPSENIPDEILNPLREARRIVREMKHEFDPKALVGQLIGNKSKSEYPIIEASKVYDKMVGRSQSIENVRRTVNSLRNSGQDGAEALRRLQSTTVLDLLEAGFGTESRQVDGVRIFNPTAFINRMRHIGNDKLRAIFSDNDEMFRRLTNIREISRDLIPPPGAVPKGSATVMMDLVNRIGLTSLTSKIPGSQMLTEGLTRLSQGAQARANVNIALQGRPQIIDLATAFDRRFPGIATVLGVSGISEKERQEEANK